MSGSQCQTPQSYCREFASLVPRIQASVPGCPHATIVQYVRDAAIRTCERTLYWRYQVPAFNLTFRVHEYLYNKPDNTDVHVLFKAFVNGQLLKPATLEQAVELYPELAEIYTSDLLTLLSTSGSSSLFNSPEYNEVVFNANNDNLSELCTPGGTYVIPVSFDSVGIKTGTPQIVTQLLPDKYIILPAPDDARVYRCDMYLALKPKHNATCMDSVVFDELEELIMHGALQHLLVLPNQPWSDRELAAYHAKQYVYQIAERRARANLGNMRNMMRVRMQPFGC